MNNLARQLRNKITNRQARIGIVGLGYVGLPLAVEFSQAGFRVVGIDTDKRLVAGIRAGRSHIEDVSSEAVAKLGAQVFAS